MVFVREILEEEKKKILEKKNSEKMDIEKECNEKVNSTDNNKDMTEKSEEKKDEAKTETKIENIEMEIERSTKEIQIKDPLRELEENILKYNECSLSEKEVKFTIFRESKKSKVHFIEER